MLIYLKKVVRAILFNDSRLEDLVIENKKLTEQLESVQGDYSFLISELTSVGLNSKEFAYRDKDIYMQRSMRLLGALIGNINNDSVSMETLTKSENLIVKEYLSYLPNYDLKLLNHYFELKQKDKVTDELCEKLGYLYRQHGNTTIGLKRFFSQRDWDKE